MTNIIQFWLTTHGPKVGTALLDANLYVRPADVNRVPQPNRGDKVLIYEQTEGEVDGKTARGGRGGIIGVAEIVEDDWRLRQTTSEFTNEMICGNHDYEGFVSLNDMGAATGHQGRFPIRGLNGGTGLLPISEQQYRALYDIFKSNDRL